MMRSRALFQALLLFGAIVAILGGASLGTLHLVAPELHLLPHLEVAYRHIIFGFLFMTLFAVAAALLEALAGTDRTGPEAEPPPPAVPTALPATAEAAAVSGLTR